MRLRVFGLGLLGAVWIAANAWAAAEPKPPGNWAAYPTRTELAATEAQPRQAGVFARAIVRCAVADDGGLNDCRIARETPVDSGLGKALLALTPKYRRVPPGKDGAREIFISNAYEPLDSPPDWIRRPTPAQLLEVFPTEAYKRGVSGRALINCISTVQGPLTDCVTLDETPAGLGFGGAAIALTPQFLMKPGLRGGKPALSSVTIPVVFKLDGVLPPIGDAKRVLPPNVAWAEAPTFADLAAAYPKKARAEGKGGRVTLNCDMTAAGRLGNCAVVTSEPFGYGFDTAAKAVAHRFLFALNTDEDRKAARNVSVHMPITFDPATLDAATPAVGKPTWAMIPNDAQIAAAFAGVKASEAVRVTLACIVRPGGTVGDCSVASESPAGAGVGAAALTLVPAFRLSTWTSEGLPVVGGAVRIPLRYEPEPSAKPAAP